MNLDPLAILVIFEHLKYVGAVMYHCYNCYNIYEYIIVGNTRVT